MRYLGLLILSCFLSSLLSAQPVISGKVKDLRGAVVPSASISIKDSYDGATSDSLGKFKFTSTEKGSKFLVVTAIGFNPVEIGINIETRDLVLDIQMKESPSELKAVVVTAGSFEASDAKRTTVLTSLDIVTTASANADVTSAIRTLPGTQQVGEKEGLFIRGGSSEEARVFIDGTLVNNFFYSSVPDIAQRGRFSPFLFKGTIFSAGGYSALYGQGLSGALILETIDLPERSSASVGIGSVGINAGFQSLNKKNTASWGVNYAYTNLLPYFAVFSQNVDYFKVPVYHYLDANYRIKTSKTGMIKFYGTFQANQLGIRSNDIDSAALKNAFSLKNHNFYLNLSWKEKLNKHWKFFTGLSYSNNRDQIGNELQDQDNDPVDIKTLPYSAKNYSGDIKGSLAQVKSYFERRVGAISAVRFGGEYLYFTDNILFTDSVPMHTVLKDNFTAAFLETDIYITNNLAAKIGTRLEHSSLINSTNLVPRVSLAYKLGLKGQTSFAYGIFYQKPERNQLAISRELAYTKATHYILNYQKLTTSKTFRVEVFYKKYEDLIKVSPTLNNTGYGYAKGIEVFWRDKKTFKGVDYWISYSFLDTKRDYLNYPYELRPNFAATHTASLVLKKFVMKWKTQFNASYTFATGRSYYDFRYSTDLNKYIVSDEGKTPNFNNLSLSINYIPAVGKLNAKRFTVWVFSVNNVLNQKQVYNYNYSYNGAYKQPVIPPANQFFYFGCFLSFGVDRTEDAINNNL